MCEPLRVQSTLEFKAQAGCGRHRQAALCYRCEAARCGIETGCNKPGIVMVGQVESLGIESHFPAGECPRFVNTDIKARIGAKKLVVRAHRHQVPVHELKPEA